MNPTQRRTYVRTTLGKAMAEVPINTYWIETEDWPSPQLRAIAGEHHGAGFAAPFAGEGDFITALCPEVIAATSAHLTDDGFVDYLRSVQIHLCLHVVHEVDDERDVLAAQRALSEYSYRRFKRVTNRAG
jgi:hypothetical protein